MELLVSEFMQPNVHTVAPDVSLPELEKAFLEAGVSGFPVIEAGGLVGIVSRSDIVRQLYHEHQLAATIPDYYFDDSGFHEQASVTFQQVAERVGERIERLTVQDVMSTHLLKISNKETLRRAAAMMCDHRVHRLLVTSQDRLVGIVSSLDLVRLIAKGRVRVAE